MHSGGNGNAMTLPGRYYTDAEIFRREMDAFFRGMWFCAGREEQIGAAGDYFLCEVAEESMIVTRDLSGAIQAFYNVCRHRGTRICREESGQFAGRIQCPYHGWTYALDGNLLGAPFMEESFRREDFPLHRVQTALWDGHVFLNLSREPRPLPEQLGELPEKFAPWHMRDLRMHNRIEYDVNANWKLIISNYNECLHCAVLHPLLCEVSDPMSGDNEAPRPGYVGGSMEFRGGAQTMSMDGARKRDYLPGLTEQQRKHVFYYAIYPNLLLSLHPDYMMVHRLWPQAVDRTKIACEWHFHPAELAKRDFVAEDVIEFWDTTNREDWDICEQSQLGISSRAYEPGPYSTREGLLSAFDQKVLELEKTHTGGNELNRGGS